jgi:hypothetical protein
MKHNGICMYNCFNIKYLCILPTECIAGFHILELTDVIYIYLIICWSLWQRLSVFFVR